MLNYSAASLSSNFVARNRIEMPLTDLNQITFIRNQTHQLQFLRFCYISSVSFIFGAITMTAGIIGVPLGSYLSTWLSKKNLRYDPWICAFGLLISAPLIASSMLMVTVSSTWAYILVFLGEVALNCNWAIVADMLLVRFVTFTHHPTSCSHLIPILYVFSS